MTNYLKTKLNIIKIPSMMIDLKLYLLKKKYDLDYQQKGRIKLASRHFKGNILPFHCSVRLKAIRLIHLSSINKIILLL